MNLAEGGEKEKRGHERDIEKNQCLAEKKYCGSTSDATTSSSIIVSFIIMLLDNFLPSKMAIFVVQKKRKTYRRTDGHELL